MRVVDPGHIYFVRTLDLNVGGERRNGEVPIVYVKREGPGYPGNKGHHPGTTMQEVLRTVVQRGEYVNQQYPCPETGCAIDLVKEAIWQLEVRAAGRHNRPVNFGIDEAVWGETCDKCGHVGCTGECHT